MDQNNRTLQNAWDEWWKAAEHLLPAHLRTELAAHLLHGCFFSGAIAMSNLWAECAQRRNTKAAQRLNAELEAYREEVMRVAAENDLKERRN